ncbi:MAG: hypothetical protein SP1CHLAM54_13170 [Chlamydiia bacterium]|nr:hypothetical protein [Chlamydiia bacterium]MCH9616213.1 hypothetical protein [Chlamydiia bacterium]MCH9629801.1 hypothetical protein [Chlamydiia bacterium]
MVVEFKWKRLKHQPARGQKKTRGNLLGFLNIQVVLDLEVEAELDC